MIKATVIKEFRDIGDFTKKHKVGDDVSGLSENRLKMLESLGCISIEGENKDELEAVRKEYEEVFGEKPHNLKKAETLKNEIEAKRKEIEDAQNGDLDNDPEFKLENGEVINPGNENEKMFP